jgi:hypothetical protein
MFSTFFSRKSCGLWSNVESYGKPGQPTDDNITLRSACRIAKQRYRHEHSEYVTIIAASWLINTFWSLTVLTQTDRLSLRSAQQDCASAGQWANGTEPGNMHCCRRHEFDIKALLCNSQYFYIFDSDNNNNNNTQNATAACSFWAVQKIHDPKGSRHVTLHVVLTATHEPTHAELGMAVSTTALGVHKMLQPNSRRPLHNVVTKKCQYQNVNSLSV